MGFGSQRYYKRHVCKTILVDFDVMALIAIKKESDFGVLASDLKPANVRGRSPLSMEELEIRLFERCTDYHGISTWYMSGSEADSMGRLHTGDAHTTDHRSRYRSAASSNLTPTPRRLGQSTGE